MISRLDTIKEILPIFKTYLGYMSQFYQIVNLDTWRDSALKNLMKPAKNKNLMIYCIKESDTIIGFAMINKHLRFNHDGLAISEFYIQKDHEKKGHGTRLAEYVFDQFPGHWEVAVTMKNNSALMFWKQVVSSYTSGNFIEKKKSSIKECGLLFKNG